MQIRKTTKTEKILVVLIMLGIVLGSVIGFTIAQSSNTFYISTGIYPNGVITIYIYGSSYHAKNAYGYLLGESNNASYLITYCSNLLTNGGKMFFKSGTYVIDRGSQVPATNFYLGCQITQDNITIEGEGVSTRFVSSNSMQRVFSFADHLGSSDGPDNIVLRNVCVDGLFLDNQHSPNAADALIAFTQDANYGVVENCLVINGNNSDGIGAFLCKYINFRYNTVYQTEHGIVLQECLYSKIYGNIITNTNTNGVVISGGYYTWTTFNEINDNIVMNCSLNGIEISGNASFCTVFKNDISFCAKGIHIVTFHNKIESNIIKACNEGLVMGYPTYTTSDANIVNGNQFLYSTDAINGYGIHEYYGSTWNIYTENVCFDNAVFGILINGNATHIDNCWNGTNWIDDYYKP